MKTAKSFTTALAVLSVVVLTSVLALAAQQRPSAQFDAPPARVFDAVYRYAQHHGKIKWADETRFTLSGSMSIAGGKWDWRKDFDCTISVEGAEGGKKSVVNVVGTYPSSQQSLVGSLGEGPAMKVLRGIREEFDKLPDQSSKGETADANLPAGSGPDAATGTVNVVSIPDGGDVYVDDAFMGNSPAALKLQPGKHIIKIKMSGYQDWEREMGVSGGNVSLNAKLIPGSSGSPTELPASGTAESQQAPTAASSGPQVKTQSSAEPNGNSGWIGVTTEDDATRGVVITRVLDGSAGATAGLKVGDVIVKLNGAPVKSGMDFDVAIAHSKVGTQIRLSYMRGAWISEATVTVGKIT